MYWSLTVFSWCENTAILAHPWYFVREKANLKRLDYHFDKRVFCICFNSLRDTRFYLFYITSAAISGDSSMFPSLRTMIKHYRHARRQGLIGEYLRLWPYCIYRTSVPSSDCEMWRFVPYVHPESGGWNYSKSPLVHTSFCYVSPPVRWVRHRRRKGIFPVHDRL